MAKRATGKGESTDLHTLYEAAVQNVEADADFIAEVFRREYARDARTLREDFCGTASLCAEWAKRHPEHRAWGIDLDRATLDWGRRHRLRPVGDAAERVSLCNEDVRAVKSPKVDLQVAFNFSYFCFKTRPELAFYFEAVRHSLAEEGLFCLDLYGGTDSLCDVEEKTKVDAGTDPDGRRYPKFTYLWEQRDFNPIDHSLRCAIHFKIKKRQRIEDAFGYDWRFWTLPELRELLAEAGFARTDVYVEGWDDEEDEPDGEFVLRESFDNEGSWIAYLVAVP